MIWLYLFIILAGSTLGQVEICQENCASTNRRKGPTRMRNSREHPWMIAQFPTKNNAFCQLGCQIFFAENPRNVTCKAECASQYRYRVTTRYSDVVEEAILNCQDGCDIALETCQAGFFCKGGEMLPCPAGTFRESSLGSNAAVDVCTQCQPGRYRARDKGKSPFSCAPCPVGKYASDTGSTSVVGCLRCPAGYRVPFLFLPC